MSQEDDDSESEPVQTGYRNTVMHHHSQIVECSSQHASCQPECIEPDIAEYVTEKSGSHVVGIPKSCTDIYERIPARGIENFP